LVSCTYCNSLHTRGQTCKSKPKDRRVKDSNHITKFRNTNAWKKKREAIRKRDLNLCMACFHLLPCTIKQYTFDSLEVHHITSLSKAYDKRLDDNNLITLCTMHHHMADTNRLDCGLLFDIAFMNTNSNWIDSKAPCPQKNNFL
jgi:5-methylcytosine-specific restriction enzyme A